LIARRKHQHVRHHHPEAAQELRRDWRPRVRIRPKAKLQGCAVQWLSALRVQDPRLRGRPRDDLCASQLRRRHRRAAHRARLGISQFARQPLATVSCDAPVATYLVP
jgi:hypothetical protein